MRILLQSISMLALLGLMFIAALFYREQIDLDQIKLITLVLTLTWFIVTPMWMGSSSKTTTTEGGSS